MNKPRTILCEPELVVIPAGSFLMGGIDEDKFVSAVELPRHRVMFSRAFGLGKRPVTHREWREIMEPATHCHLDLEHPMVRVSYREILTFLGKLSEKYGQAYRLPSEAEWEYTCRAGSCSVFPSGSTISLEEANFLYDENGREIGLGEIMPAGQFPPNHHGVHDLLGNVCEWTADVWHANFDAAPTDGSAWTHGGKLACRSIRGGAWDHLPRLLRASWRDWAPEKARWDNLGFRIALSL